MHTRVNKISFFENSFPKNKYSFAFSSVLFAISKTKNCKIREFWAYNRLPYDKTQQAKIHA